MKKYFQSSLGRLRMLAVLEGLSLICLVFIGVPLKHFLQNGACVKALGPVHGVLFLLYVLNAFSFSTQAGWSFRKTTWKILVATMIPFGTFVIDRKILKPLHDLQENA